jgi:hypothetical protein
MNLLSVVAFAGLVWKAVSGSILFFGEVGFVVVCHLLFDRMLALLYCFSRAFSSSCQWLHLLEELSLTVGM